MMPDSGRCDVQGGGIDARPAASLLPSFPRSSSASCAESPVPPSCFGRLSSASFDTFSAVATSASEGKGDHA